MVDLSRRSFLKITGVGLAAIAAPIAFSKIGRLPVIIGDGVHDDTKGLQAAMDGKPFVCESGLVTSTNGTIELRGGEYLITSPLNVKAGTTIRGGSIQRSLLNMRGGGSIHDMRLTKFTTVNSQTNSG